MYDMKTRERALHLVRLGRSLNSVSRETGIARSSLRSWIERPAPLPRMRRTHCFRCRPDPGPPHLPDVYAYLLGLYLGDGCVSRSPHGGWTLRIACADAWPGLTEECARALEAMNPSGRSSRTQAPGCKHVQGFSHHWVCLFPQHGPGRKHERPIVLADWQRAVVREHPWDFLRGLIHSDGCRTTNWTAREVAGGLKRYEYPRYFFTNRSDDIRRLCTDALDRVGVEWTALHRDGVPLQISVARKSSVARMDAHIGPKY